jgi:hypothetical protein
MRRVWWLVLLAGCASPPPELMQPCAVSTLPPQPPKSGHRTIQNLATWANNLQLAREATDHALVECSQRQAGLAQWIRNHWHE